MFWGGLVLPLALLSLCSPGADGRAKQPDDDCVKRSFWKGLMRGLKKVNPVFAHECRSEQDKELKTPSVVPPVGSHKASTVAVVLEGMKRIFSSSNSALPRNERLDFVNAATRILTQLQTCIRSPPIQNMHEPVVQARFQKIEQFLQTKKNSRCAWEVVHKVSKGILRGIRNRYNKN